jgi:CheY-like chemotaxis protein
MNTSLHRNRPANAMGPPAASPASKPLIMIVGPSEETRYMFRVMLELWDYEVLEAETSEESLDLGRKRHPALLLLDTTVDFEDGLDSISKIIHDDELTAIPSIMMSGYSQETYRDAALSSGASHFMAKPVDFDLLQIYIETLLKNDNSLLQGRDPSYARSNRR